MGTSIWLWLLWLVACVGLVAWLMSPLPIGRDDADAPRLNGDPAPRLNGHHPSPTDAPLAGTITPKGGADV